MQAFVDMCIAPPSVRDLADVELVGQDAVDVLLGDPLSAADRPALARPEFGGMTRIAELIGHGHW